MNSNGWRSSLVLALAMSGFAHGQTTEYAPVFQRSYSYKPAGKPDLENSLKKGSSLIQTRPSYRRVAVWGKRVDESEHPLLPTYSISDFAAELP